jgi:uncharacterized protein
MEYRSLGRTGFKASAIGLGCGELGSSPTSTAVRIVQRALDLGVNYFDVAKVYRDGEAKLGLALQGKRDQVFVSTKTRAKTRDEAWQHLHESLKLLRTDHLDNFHLHNLQTWEDMEQRLAPGGALEALIQAKEQGLIRHIGCTGHVDAILAEAIRRFPFELVLVPMNIVEREPLDELIPLCRERGVGITIMKPLATGLLPAQLSLKWVLNQPIDCVVPGATTLAEVEENSRIGSGDYHLSAGEAAQVAELRNELNRVRCRICYECAPCPKGVRMDYLGTDLMYEHYRNMGREGFRSFPWSRLAIEDDLPRRKRLIASVESCDRCGECETKCRYGLPVMDMLQDYLVVYKDVLSLLEEAQARCQET